MKTADVKDMDVKALEKEIAVLQKELFELRLSAASSHIKDNSQFKKLRIRIAQVLTYLKQKQS